jgi:hypothetical protein
MKPPESSISLQGLLRLFRNEEIPRWFKALNIISLLPILAWPLVFFGSIFIFDHPSSFRNALVVFVLMNSYPVFLIAFVHTSLRLFKTNRSVSIMIPAAIIIAFGILMSFVLKQIG